jgi:hypothetical protein
MNNLSHDNAECMMGLAVRMAINANYDSFPKRQAKICRGPDYGDADLKASSGF